MRLGGADEELLDGPGPPAESWVSPGGSSGNAPETLSGKRQVGSCSGPVEVIVVRLIRIVLVSKKNCCSCKDTEYHPAPDFNWLAGRIQGGKDMTFKSVMKECRTQSSI